MKMPEISRRDFNKTLLGGLAGTTMLSGSARQAGNAKTKVKPNIVFICSDQHSYKYTGYMGHPVVRTPNMDRIAREGVTFTNAYTGQPVCTPGRACMMTGMFASDSHSYCNSTVWDGSHPTWGTHLKQQGYSCRAIGKMDLNDDFDSGFEEIETSHGHRHNPDITSLFRRPVAYRIGERENVDGSARSQRHRDGGRAELALQFLREAAPGEKQPWAIYVGMTAPHPKFIALQSYYDMYPTDNIDMPNIPPGHLENLHLAFQELRRFKRIATPISEDRVRRARAGYYGLVSELDEYVGKIYDALQRTGALQNTLFIYTSDHGESLGEHGLWYKNNLYDVAARVPLLIAGAGLPRGKRVETPVAHVDLVAMMLEMAQSEAAGKLRGHSLLPMLQGTPGNHPGFAFSESHSEGNCTGSFMIRKGDWKYIHFTWYDDLLFNVKDDPGEFNNLIAAAGTNDIREELKALLHAQLDPEAVTVTAFQTQDKFLHDMAARMTEEELAKVLQGRLGPGLARVLSAKAKGR
jgi:choline-sulfatase